MMELMTKEHDVIKNLFSIIYRLKEEIEEISGTCRPCMNGEIYMDHEEVCKVLHVSRRTLQQYRDDGIIPFIQLPGKVIYRETDIMLLLERNYKGVDIE